MKLVIDIPEDFYKEWCDYIIPSDKVTACTHIIIQQGTVLPEGHGDLIDRDALIQKQLIPNHSFELVGLSDLNAEPVIIPADNGQCFDCKSKTDSCQEGLHCIKDEE